MKTIEELEQEIIDKEKEIEEIDKKLDHETEN